jgi:hypothetical protein
MGTGNKGGQVRKGSKKEEEKVGRGSRWERELGRRGQVGNRAGEKGIMWEGDQEGEQEKRRAGGKGEQVGRGTGEKARSWWEGEQERRGAGEKVSRWEGEQERSGAGGKGSRR